MATITARQPIPTDLAAFLISTKAKFDGLLPPSLISLLLYVQQTVEEE